MKNLEMEMVELTTTELQEVEGGCAHCYIPGYATIKEYAGLWWEAVCDANGW
jgi:bacteriocin-like protein